MKKRIVFNVHDQPTILSMTCDFFGVSVDDVKGKSRKREFVVARQTSMYLMDLFFTGTLKAIGIFHGGRDHSTVIHSKETVNDMMATNREYKARVEELQNKIVEGKSREFKEFVFTPAPVGEEIKESLEILKEVNSQL